MTIANFGVWPGHPCFAKPEPIQNHIVVFPRTCVWIQPEGAEALVADPTIVTLYNRGQRYRRQAIGGEADRCDWFALSPEFLEQPFLRERFGPLDPTAPFKARQTRCHPRVYAAQRRLVRHLETTAAEEIDRERIEQDVSLILTGLGGLAEEESPGHPETWWSHRIKAFVAEHRFDSMSLADIADRLRCSVSFLSKAFKEATGSTVARYRRQLRLGLSLERLQEESAFDLSSLAGELGFCSHSHFTESFRRVFGLAPSEYRKLLAVDAGAFHYDDET
ncbi:MAG: AraC family transcriptional regulator [Thermoanaerobaculia bacterium]|nr:AraC family transcriptional regulator [Thermoanaerobaculia bacterium]